MMGCAMPRLMSPWSVTSSALFQPFFFAKAGSFARLPSPEICSGTRQGRKNMATYITF